MPLARVYFVPRIPELYIRFYSLSGLKTDTVTPHPAATLPFVRLHTVDSGKLRGVFKLQIVGDYVVLELWVEIGADRTSFFVDVYNWKTGQMMSVRTSSSLTCTEANPSPGSSIMIDD